MSERETTFFLGTTLLPKAENEPYKGDFGDEGPLEQPHDTDWYLDRMVEERQGNLVVLWASICAPAYRPKLMKDWNGGEPILKLAAKMKKHGLALMTFYSQGHHGEVYLDERVVRALAADKDLTFLGENIGEAQNKWFSAACPQNAPDRVFPDLLAIKNAYVNDFLKSKALKIKALGYPKVFSAGVHAMADYELEAGVDFPMNENVETGYNVAEARGAWKKWNAAGWGLYVNHDWYTRNVPYDAQAKYDMLKISLYQAWMSGAFAIILESGNLWTEAGFYTKNSDRNYPYESERCRRYREVVREFFDFTQTHSRPSQSPEIRICFARGYLDGFNGSRKLVDPEDKFCHHRYNVFGAKANAKENFNYVYGDPEWGWDIFFKIAAPMNPDALSPYKNHRLCGSPFGLADIVGIDDNASEALMSGYSLIVYSGWNTMTPEIYRKLTRYVENGGALLMALPHCSTRTDREYWRYSAGDLVHGGDLTALFGVRVNGKGNFVTSGYRRGVDAFTYPFYDYDAEQESEMAISTIPDIKVETWLANVELAPNVEVLIESETRGQFKRGENAGKPIVIRHRLGKGAAYLVCSWEYPGAPGVKPLYAWLVKNLMVEHAHPDCRVVDPGTSAPGPECANVFFAVYPQTAYLINADTARPRRLELHLKNRIEPVTLAPAEFKVVDLA